MQSDGNFNGLVGMLQSNVSPLYSLTFVFSVFIFSFQVVIKEKIFIINLL